MVKKLIVFFGVSLLMLFVAVFWFNAQQVDYSSRQVKKIAPSVQLQPLAFFPHISDVDRPKETYAFPIALGGVGPIDTLYAGARQYPFYCMTIDSGLGQPLVDNQLGFGVPVYRDNSEDQQLMGYSKDCLQTTRLSYFRITTQDDIIELAGNDLSELAADDYLIRVEQGTINRFIYTIAMPITALEFGGRLAHRQWNHRLIYQFNGGSGIGFRQGKQSAQRVIQRQLQQLKDGYAVISSSGNKTSYTYNMLLAEDTARRVKQQFVSLYGEPLYTVGIGGSGGGLAQYLIAQNSQGILDGLIPLYSYPDMITQTTYALDCDLLNNYFTFRANDRSDWQDWTLRRTVEGMNAINGFPQKAGYLQPMNQLLAGFVPRMPSGNSECINGYFGLSSFINNPRQGFIRNFFSDAVVAQNNWSYWQDLYQILGTDERGMGLSTWDNVGVQYGLVALTSGDISIEQFLDINQKIGSWKPQSQMVSEQLHTPVGRKLPFWLSLWGNHNITDIIDGVAPRHNGSLRAMENAYRSGQVFIGRVALPVLDVRHYLEDELDMHHISASFYARERMIKANGHSDNQVIWIAEKDFNPVNQAFAMMDTWLLNRISLKAQGYLSKVSYQHQLALTLASRPQSLKDTCFDSQGGEIASGSEVWDGKWNRRFLGACQQYFPVYSTSRIQAGGSWAGDVFKCQLQSVQQAIDNDVYLDIDMRPYQAQLEAIFPDGVCNYQLSDAGRPSDL